MAVGEPEISLNTWGLKYVRKDDKGQIKVDGGKVGDTSEKPQQASGTTPASSTGINIQHEDTSSSVGGKVDTTTSFGAGHATRHASTGDQGQANRSNVKPSKAPSSKPSSSITNPKTSKRVPAESQTHNSGTGTAAGAFTPEGKETTAGHEKHGDKAPSRGYESNTERDEKGKEVLGKKGKPKKITVQDDSPKAPKWTGGRAGGHKINREKPEHGGTPSGVASTSLPKAKAILELAINKCKLLKAKSNLSKGLGGEGRHTAGYLKEIESGAQKFLKDGKTGGSESPDKSAKEYLESNKTRTGAKIPDEKLGELPQGGQDNSGNSTTTIEGADGKEKEIETGYKKWEKEHKQKTEVFNNALELVNQTIATIEKDFHPAVDRDTVDKDAAATTSTQGMANFVYSDVKEDQAKKKAEKPFGKVLDEEGRPDEYTKEEHAEHDSNKDKQ